MEVDSPEAEAAVGAVVLGRLGFGLTTNLCDTDEVQYSFHLTEHFVMCDFQLPALVDLHLINPFIFEGAPSSLSAGMYSIGKVLSW